MPKIWEDTVDAHRDAVKEAIAKATAKLVHRDGVTGLTMSAIATEAGVGRATLYRYVKDAKAALELWQAYGIEFHIQQLNDIATTAPADRRLAAVLERYALNRQHRHGPAHSDLRHSDALLSPARKEVRRLVTELLIAESMRGNVRTDMPPDHLAAYAVAAMDAASDLPTPHAARHLAQLVHTSLLVPGG